VTVIVIQFITLDGFVSDPDGSGGTPGGGWAFRHGRPTVAGDKFRLGRVLDDGVLLLGRRTWQLFSRLWPGRDDPFAYRMNAVPKLVASRTLNDVSAWANSEILQTDLVHAVEDERRDVIITGSLSIVHTLIARDLVDEYRLLTFPTVLGSGRRLFPDGRPPAYLETLSAEPAGAAVLTRYASPRTAHSAAGETELVYPGGGASPGTAGR
jgi:dihydrofolate reductase